MCLEMDSCCAKVRRSLSAASPNASNPDGFSITSFDGDDDAILPVLMDYDGYEEEAIGARGAFV